MNQKSITKNYYKNRLKTGKQILSNCLCDKKIWNKFFTGLWQILSSRHKTFLNRGANGPRCLTEESSHKYLNNLNKNMLSKVPKLHKSF